MSRVRLAADMPKDMQYNIAAVVLSVGGPLLAIFFFRKAIQSARKELSDVG